MTHERARVKRSKNAFTSPPRVFALDSSGPAKKCLSANAKPPITSKLYKVFLRTRGSELIKFGKPKFKCSRKFPAVRFLTCRPPVAVRAPPRSFLEVCARQPCRSRAALLFIDWRRENSRGLKIDCTPVKMLHFFRRSRAARGMPPEVPGCATTMRDQLHTHPECT